MGRRLGALIVLLGLVVVLGACSAGSAALGRVGGCGQANLGTQVPTYFRTWARDAQYQQEFIDTYFLNYDVNDPYRCECPTYDYCSMGCGGMQSGCR